MSTQATPSAFATNPMGMAQILLFIGLTEGYTFPEGAWSGDMKREPGDLGYRVMRSADVMEEQQIKELKNGGAPRPFLRVGGVRGAGSLTGRHPRRPRGDARHHGVQRGALHPGLGPVLLQRVGCCA
jgi:hypothetical protein